MDTNLNKETNDKQALDALIHCSEFYVLSFSNDTFFTEIAGGRKLLWCCASVADLAVIMKAAYADRVNDAIICTTSMRWLMTEWAKDPTVEMSFVWNTRVENGETLLPFIAPVTRRGVLQHIVETATKDKQAMQRNAQKALSGIEALNLLGVLLPESADSTASLEEYIYENGESGLRYLRWLKDPVLMASYKARYPKLSHTYKNIPDIIQCIEHHGLGGLTIEREDSIAVLTAADLMGIHWLAQKSSPLTSICQVDHPYKDRIVSDWADFTRTLTFSNCGFNLHTLHGSAVGALLMYCIIDNYLNQNKERQRQYHKLQILSDEKQADQLLLNVVTLADDIDTDDKSLPTSVRAKLRLLSRKIINHGECSFEECDVLPMCDSMPFYEDNYRIYRMAAIDYYSDIIRQGMMHLEDSVEEIEYYVDYTKSCMPDLMNEWAAAVSTAQIRNSHLVKVKGYTIHDAIKVVQSQFSFFSVGRTIHDGYKLLVRLHRGDIEFPNTETVQVSEKAQTVYVQVPEFTGKNEQREKPTYTPIPTSQASSGFLYDLDDVEPTINDMPHTKLRDDSLCTYIMQSGDFFTFKVLDMKRAERSLYVYLLTADVPYSAEAANECLLHFYAHPDILLEAGMDIMNARTTNPVTVAGYTARSLQSNTSMTYIETYLCLMTLRENPEKAIKLINEKWKEG